MQTKLKREESMLSFTAAVKNDVEVGDVITVDSKKYKVIKKTTTAVSVTRHYWFDALWDKIIKRFV